MDGAEGGQEGHGGGEVDAHSEVEVGFAAGGHYAVEDVDRIEGDGGRDEILERGGIAEIGLDGCCILWMFGFWRNGRRNDVGEYEGILGVGEEAFGE